MISKENILYFEQHLVNNVPQLNSYHELYHWYLTTTHDQNSKYILIYYLMNNNQFTDYHKTTITVPDDVIEQFDNYVNESNYNIMLPAINDRFMFGELFPNQQQYTYVHSDLARIALKNNFDRINDIIVHYQPMSLSTQGVLLTAAYDNEVLPIVIKYLYELLTSTPSEQFINDVTNCKNKHLVSSLLDYYESLLEE